MHLLGLFYRVKGLTVHLYRIGFFCYNVKNVAKYFDMLLLTSHYFFMLFVAFLILFFIFLFSPRYIQI